MILSLLATLAFQDVRALDRAVAAFTGHAAGETGGARAPVDPRLRLKICPTVALSWRTPQQDAVVVSCTGPDWRLFVPVNRVASASPAPTAAAAAGAPAMPALVTIARADPVIRRGDPVLIEAGQDGFAITREGIAQADAAPGARVAVRVEGTPVPVQAVAIASGRATLPGWSR
jgi:flagella basal body P-ring formation protein FlgA